MNYSFWEQQFITKPLDVTIIGAGIVGLSTAISIKELSPNTSIKILERGHLPYGASTKNAGFSCFGSVSELMDDIDTIGESTCMEIVKMRWLGLQILKQRVGEQHLEYHHGGGTELFRSGDQETMEACMNHVQVYNAMISDHLGLKDCYLIRKNEVVSAWQSHAIYNQYEGTINPMSMMQRLYQIAIEKGISIFYGIEVQDLDQENHILKCGGNLDIQYKKLIVCTNGFTQMLFPHLDVVPARNQVIITQPISGLTLNSGYHVDKGYIYFRNYQNRILLGGGRNLNPDGEMTFDFGHTAQIQTYLEGILEEIHPGASNLIDNRWSGILGIGPSKFPIIQWLDNHILAGVRLGGMGVAIGSYLGKVLAEQVVETVNIS
jgi:gamma-glutamylputrescine oxidase